MKKNGFTLIELLAVIVILAVIALIVTPVISGIINKTKESANLRSAEGYITSVKTKLLSNMISDSKMNDGIYTVNQLKGMNIEFSGEGPTNGELAILDNKVVSAELLFGTEKVLVNSNGIVTSKSKIYGLKWNGGTSYERLKDAYNMDSCVGTDTISCVSDFDNAEIYSEIHDVVIDGNSFVYIPKFYIKKVVAGDTWEWYISKSKQDDDYYLPECFHDVETNRELPYVLVGKYNASLSENNKLESKSEVIPLVKNKIDEMRLLAPIGYQLLDIHTLDALQVLFYIEFGTLNSQSIMSGYTAGRNLWVDAHKVVSTANNSIVITTGAGHTYSVGQLIDIATSPGARDVVTNLKVVGITDDILTVEDTKYTEHLAPISVDNIVYNVANINGQTNNVKASSGSISSNTTGRYSMKYRGIENLYGNIWQFIDGVNVDNDTNKILVNRNSKTYASENINDDYKEIGYDKINDNGWVSKMGYDSNYPFIQFPVVVEKNENLSYADNFWTNTTVGTRIVLYGGYWFYGSSAGITSYIDNVDFNYFNNYTGSRIVKKAIC